MDVHIGAFLNNLGKTIWTMFTTIAFTTSKGKLIVPIENNSGALANIRFASSYVIPL
jgi:hypothetical protein